MQFEPESPLHLDLKIFSLCPRSAPSGSAPGHCGCTNEMVKVVSIIRRRFNFLGLAAADFARATSPRSVTHSLTLATALQKKDGGVRGIATGTSFRRLVAKTLAKQFGKTVEAACAPFQFALSTRAGVDCVGRHGPKRHSPLD